ncbi:MAG TPA: hypothetical protein VGP99_12210 [Tepidisphaeraceae bacterium]|nr:hypothetical protein [Tepidisphaeraceae bacterium]
MSEQVPVLKYAVAESRKPVGFIVLSVNLGAGVLLSMIGLTIDGLLFYQMCRWVWFGRITLQPEMLPPFGLATLLGTGSLLCGVFLIIGVFKEIKRRRKQPA